MCLAIPMKIEKIKGANAIAGAAGLRREVNIQMMPHLKTGDYVIVHAGFAIQKLDPQAAKDTLKLINEIH